MCLSTVYNREKNDDNILCRYVASIEVEGDQLTFTDVMGMVTRITGRLVSADLTSGTVVVSAA